MIAKSSLFLKSGELTQIPVYFGKSLLQDEYASEILLYEGENQHVQSLTGIVKGSEGSFVLGSKSNKGKYTIKKDEVVGYTYSVECQDMLKEENNPKWSAELLSSKILLDNLSPEKKDHVLKMLLGVQEALSQGDHDVGSARVEPHKIELTNETPVWQRPRNFSQPVNEEVEKQCKELMLSDILEFSNSNWSSPVVPVRKVNGDLRICIDYRLLNRVTKTEKFPMPNLNNCVYRPSKVKFFTKLDMVRGYYQVPIDEKSRQYTAFSTVQNHYQFKRLSFGLKNSGIAFQKLMQQVLSPVLTSNIIIYIDDILIMSESFDDHIETVQKVLMLLAKYSIKIKVDKCEFFKEEVKFLGHVINGNGLRKSEEYVKSVKNVKKPTTVKEMRKFLGLINFQRKFIEDCSLLTQSLSPWTAGNRNRKIAWSTEMDEAFDKLIEEVEKVVFLTHPDYTEGASKMELYVDASEKGAGACLQQRRNGTVGVIAYASMTFSPTQRRYHTWDRELAALRWGVATFRCFITGVPFIIFTDHRPLTYLYTMSSTNSRLARTLEELAEFDFVIHYRPGKYNQAADFLSRMSEHCDVEECADYTYLPKEIKRIVTVEGGGDSLFEALHIALTEAKEHEDLKCDIPDSQRSLRNLLIEDLLLNLPKYGLDTTKQVRQKLKLMKRPGQQPIFEVLMAAAKLFSINIHVYHGMRSPVVYTHGDVTKRVTIRLQCISNIHFNPLYERKSLINENIEAKNINFVTQEDSTMEEKERFLEDDLQISQQENTGCGHQMYHVLAKLCSDDENRYCCMIDTGAQVSLMCEETYLQLKSNMFEIELKRCMDSLVGVNKQEERILGFVTTTIEIHGVKSKEMPFAVVKKGAIPCCLVLGANFLVENSLELDFGKNLLAFNVDNNCERYMINNAFVKTLSNYKLDVMVYFGLTVKSIDNIEDDSVNNFKYIITSEKLKAMQAGDFAIKMLFSNVKRKVNPRLWKHKAINQFKRESSRLNIVDGLLRKGNTFNSPIVTSFPFLVEILAKTHCQLEHIGREKLLYSVAKFFWHPALRRVSSDLCRSCSQCQLNKIGRQVHTRPVRKISAEYPFQLMCMDILEFPRTSRGNVAFLVCIDHFSKWLNAIPIRDKKARTVSKALTEQVLAKIPRVPDRILTDNGPEFIAEEFADTLNSFNIDHSFSTPYHAAGNGAVERVNRTTILRLQSLLDCDWDLNIPKVVIHYNSMVHSETKLSPSDCILRNAHNTAPQLLIDKRTLENWKEGHPNFRPFEVGDKVAKKKRFCGNRLGSKLSSRYEGPFIVQKIFNSGVSYEIAKEDDKRIMKVNHRFLKPWFDIPDYLKKYLYIDQISEVCDKDDNEKEFIYSDSDSSLSEISSSSSDSFSGRFTNSSNNKTLRRCQTSNQSDGTTNNDGPTSLEKDSETTATTLGNDDVRTSTWICGKRYKSLHEYIAMSENFIDSLMVIEQNIGMCDEILDKAIYTSNSIDLADHQLSNSGTCEKQQNQDFGPCQSSTPIHIGNQELRLRRNNVSHDPELDFSGFPCPNSEIEMDFSGFLPIEMRPNNLTSSETLSFGEQANSNACIVLEDFKIMSDTLEKNRKSLDELRQSLAEMKDLINSCRESTSNLVQLTPNQVSNSSNTIGPIETVSRQSENGGEPRRVLRSRTIW